MVDLTDDTLARQCLELRDRLRSMFDEARAAVARWDLPATPPRSTRRGS
jgi:hypothetical protein